MIKYGIWCEFKNKVKRDRNGFWIFTTIPHGYPQGHNTREQATAHMNRCVHLSTTRLRVKQIIMKNFIDSDEMF